MSSAESFSVRGNLGDLVTDVIITKIDYRQIVNIGTGINWFRISFSARFLGSL
jgi:hypothetical protein